MNRGYMPNLNFGTEVNYSNYNSQDQSNSTPNAPDNSESNSLNIQNAQNNKNDKPNSINKEFVHVAIDSVKKKRKKVQRACIYCRRSHMTCDIGRPCQRCIKRDIAHLCRDEVDPTSATKKKYNKKPKQLKNLISNIQIKPLSNLNSPSPTPSSNNDFPGLINMYPPNMFDNIPDNPDETRPNLHLIDPLDTNDDDPSLSPSVTSLKNPDSYMDSENGDAFSQRENPQDASTNYFKSSLPPFNQAPTPSLQKIATNLSLLRNAAHEQAAHVNAANSTQNASSSSPYTYPDSYLRDNSLNAEKTNNSRDIPEVLSIRQLLNPSSKINQADSNKKPLSQIIAEGNKYVREHTPASGSNYFNNSSLTEGVDVYKQSELDNLSLKEIKSLYETEKDDLYKKYENYFNKSLKMNVTSMEDKLQELLLLKFEAGLLRPYSYVQGYLRMHKYMEKRMSTESVTKIVGIMRIYRPTFQVTIKSLSDVDMLASEITFERQLLEYDYVFFTFGVPACLWRRTGEIYKANKEFADLVGIPLQYLREGRVSIYELMTEESFVNYFEKFSNIAFDVSQKAVLTSCVLQVSDSVREMIGRDRMMGMWSKDVHKDLELLPLVLGASGEKDIESFDPNSIVAFFKEFWESSKKLDKTKLNSEYIFDNSHNDNSIFINEESKHKEFISAKDLLEGTSEYSEEQGKSTPQLGSSNMSPYLNGNEHSAEPNVNGNNVSSSLRSPTHQNSTEIKDGNELSSPQKKSRSLDEMSTTSSTKRIDDFGIPRKKISCCFSLTIRRDKNCLPVAIIGNFIPNKN